MTLSATEALFVSLALIYALPVLVWRITGLDRIVPVAIVQIVMGVLLGPSLVGSVWPSYYEALFPAENVALLSGFATWAVSLFLFAVGLELDLKGVWRDRVQVTTTVGLGLGVPVLFGVVVAVGLLIQGREWVGDAAAGWQFAVAIGLACAVTSLPILMLILEKLEILRTPFGQRVLRYASLDDIVLWAVTAVILLDWDRLGRQALVFVGLAVGAVVVRRTIVRLKGADRWYLSLVWLALVACAADWCGLHYMVGAFLAGVVLDAEALGLREVDRFREHVLLLVLPMYFLSTGLKTQWNVADVSVLVAAAALFAAQLAGKLVGMDIAARLFRWPRRDAYLLGWLLQTKSLILLIFANILLDRDIISDRTFAALFLMAISSTLATLPAVRWRLRERTGSRAAERIPGPLHPVPVDVHRPRYEVRVLTGPPAHDRGDGNTTC